MARFHGLRWVIVAAASLLALLAFILFQILFSQPASEALPLFSTVSVTAENTDASGSLRSRIVTVDIAVLRQTFGADGAPVAGPPATIEMNLFDDVTFTAILDRIDYRSSESFTWNGHLAAVDRSTVSLSVEGSVILGNITMPGRSFQLRYLREGLHVIHEMDPAASENR